jgi:outer membrane biosynthesis protein TonB
MLPQTQARKKRNSSKVNFFISFTFHTLLAVMVLYFAARQGWLGQPLKKLSVDLVKEKKPEKPKEPEKPKAEPPKVVETPKPVEAPKPVETAKAPPSVAPPAVAPPAVELPSFVFEGGKAVISSSDPVEIYKSALENAFRSKWNRPENMADDNYAAEVEVSVARDGQISDPVWQKGSGNSRWDDSVRAAIAAVTSLDRPPPTNFPPRVIIRFDVQEETEPVLQ